MFIEHSLYIFLSAYILDYILGDPVFLPHPVIWMGNFILFFENIFRKIIKDEFISGLLFAVFSILSTWIIAFVSIKLVSSINLVMGDIFQTILVFYCLSSKTLEKEAYEVGKALEKHGLNASRKKVSMIVGRQVKYLDKTGVIKASIETVAENFVQHLEYQEQVFLFFCLKLVLFAQLFDLYLKYQGIDHFLAVQI